MITDKLKEEKQRLCHIKLIEQARKILENRLNNEKNYIDEDAYNIFVISAFLLVKENLIKKDCLNDILYFDCNNNEYIPYIIELAEKIDKNDYIKNNTTVRIQNNNAPQPKLKNAIWLVNKIRDSLAHGAYEIKKDKINIDNDHTDEPNSYKLTTTLDIDDLANFILSTVTKTKIDKDKIFKYISPILKKELEKEKLYLSFNRRNMKILHDIPKNHLRNNPNYIRIYLSVKSENGKFKIYIENYDEIDTMIKRNRNLINNLEYNINVVEQLIEEAYEEKARAIKASYIISKIIEYFNSLNIEDTIDYIYLYNYMSLVFTYNSEDRVKIPNLDLTKINFNLNDTDYNNMKLKITELVNGNASTIKDKWKIYEKRKDVVPIEIVYNQMSAFHKKIKEKIISCNNIIIRSLRNGIEHANFEEQNSLIKITDKSNQNSSNEKAIFIGTVHDFYMLTTYIERQKLNFIDETFDIALLENYIPSVTFQKLIYAILNEENHVHKKNKLKTK